MKKLTTPLTSRIDGCKIRGELEWKGGSMVIICWKCIGCIFSTSSFGVGGNKFWGEYNPPQKISGHKINV